MVTLSPVGLAAAPVANQVSLLATFKEELCKCVCSTSSNQPFATISYRYEQPILNGTTVFVPIVASISIQSPGCKAPRSITERFMVAFQGRTAVPASSVTITQVGMTQGLFKIVCGKSKNYVINSSITVSIPAQAATPAA